MARELNRVPGWQEALSAAPIAISANTSCVAAYCAPDGECAASPHVLNQAVTNGPLAVSAVANLGGNGVYNYNNGFPMRGYRSASFFVDIAFIPSGTYLSLTASPSNPTVSSTGSLGSVVATLASRWSDGAPCTGTLSFAAPHFSRGGVFARSAINPRGPGVGATAGKAETVTIGATQ